MAKITLFLEQRKNYIFEDKQLATQLYSNTQDRTYKQQAMILYLSLLLLISALARFCLAGSRGLPNNSVRGAYFAKTQHQLQLHPTLNLKLASSYVFLQTLDKSPKVRIRRSMKTLVS
jgi:hypothetical protein